MPEEGLGWSRRALIGAGVAMPLAGCATDAPSLPPEMLRALLSGMAAFTVLYIGFVVLRYGLARLDNLREGAGDAV